MTSYRKQESPRWGLVLVAAGNARRMGGVDKLMIRLGDHTVLWHALNAFYRSGRFSEVAMVTSAERFGRLCEEVAGWNWRLHQVEGGSRRQDSVAAGLQRLAAANTPPEYVAIHDGARPCLDEDLIPRVLAAAEADGAAAAALPLADTLRRASAEGWAETTIDRAGLWRMQTPQAFRLSWILDAHRRFGSGELEFTDDVAMAQRAGYRVRLVPGSSFNLKLTVPEDLGLVRRLYGVRPEAT